MGCGNRGHILQRVFLRRLVQLDIVLYEVNFTIGILLSVRNVERKRLLRLRRRALNRLWPIELAAVSCALLHAYVALRLHAARTGIASARRMLLKISYLLDLLLRTLRRLLRRYVKVGACGRQTLPLRLVALQSLDVTLHNRSMILLHQALDVGAINTMG